MPRPNKHNRGAARPLTNFSGSARPLANFVFSTYPSDVSASSIAPPNIHDTAPHKIRLRTRRLDPDSIPFFFSLLLLSLSLSLSSSSSSSSSSSLFLFLSTAMVMAEWKPRRRDFISALEEERRKIQMFSRELPLCLQLVSEAIDGLQRQMGSDEICGDKPMMDTGASNCKQDWLRSARLWNPAAADDLTAEAGTLRKPVAVNAKRVGKAFQPFERNKFMPAVLAPPPAPAVSSVSGGRRDGGEGVEKKDAEEDQSLATAQSNRKQRRCWSAGLHRKFLNALEQLGGSHAATPKQIREMMKVDGLTNDEVKSHLQKYRLHMRRPMVTVQSSSSNNTQNHSHFVLLSSIWVPPQEYAATASATATTQPAEGSKAILNGIYSPIESLTPAEIELGEEQLNKKQQKNKPPVMLLYSQQRSNQDDDSLVDDAATISNSSSTSFLSQTKAIPPLRAP